MDRRTFIEKSAMGALAIAAPINISPLRTENRIKTGLIGAGWLRLNHIRSAGCNSILY